MTEQTVIDDIINEIEKEKARDNEIKALFLNAELSPEHTIMQRDINQQAKIMGYINPYSIHSPYFKRWFEKYYRNAKLWKMVFGLSLYVEKQIKVKPNVERDNRVLAIAIIDAIKDSKYYAEITKINVNENRVETIKGQRTKLTKYLAKINQNLLNEYSTALTNNNTYTLRLSAQPADMLTASEICTYSSCYNMEGEYSAGPWDSVESNNGRILIAFCYLKKQSITRSLNHPKKLWRCWVFLSNDLNTIAIMNHYPNRNNDIEKGLVELLGDVFYNGDYHTDSGIESKIRYQNFGGYADPCETILVKNGKSISRIELVGGHTCPECGKFTKYDNHILCDYCHNDDIAHCYNCGEQIDLNYDCYQFDGEYYCEYCFDEHFTYCDICGEACYIEETTEYYHDIYCQRCADRFLLRCDECNRLVHENDTYMGSNDGNVYCEECYETTHSPCDICGDIVLAEDITEIDGEFYCPECYSDAMVENGNSNIGMVI